MNVTGTQNVIRACQECNILKLVYTSSSNVVLDGSDCQNGDESMKYVSKKNHLNAYSWSKHKAEEKVLLANNSECLNKKFKLLTCALRPHCIFGPRDTHFISQIINKARAGKITHMIGEGHNITDFTYIDNVVHAHILASKHLKQSNATAAGQVYFITNGEPTLFWSFLGQILQQLGCPRPTKFISYNVAYAIALIMEFIYMIFGWIFGWKPIITRQMVVTMACHHWFSHAKATRDLGYKPIVTLDHGIKKTVQWLQWQHRGRRRRNLSYERLNEMGQHTDSSESLRSLRSDTSIHSRSHSNSNNSSFNQRLNHINQKNNFISNNNNNINNNHNQFNQRFISSSNVKNMHIQHQHQQNIVNMNNNNNNMNKYIYNNNNNNNNMNSAHNNYVNMVNNENNVTNNNNNNQNNQNNVAKSTKIDNKNKNENKKQEVDSNSDDIVPLD